jgi:hypothetical protein
MVAFMLSLACGRTDSPQDGGDSQLADGKAGDVAEVANLSFCWRDGGGLTWEARACSIDSDCSVIERRTCCGYSATWVAAARIDKYSPC